MTNVANPQIPRYHCFRRQGLPRDLLAQHEHSKTLLSKENTYIFLFYLKESSSGIIFFLNISYCLNNYSIKIAILNISFQEEKLKYIQIHIGMFFFFSVSGIFRQHFPLKVLNPLLNGEKEINHLLRPYMLIRYYLFCRTLTKPFQ